MKLRAILAAAGVAGAAVLTVGVGTAYADAAITVSPSSGLADTATVSITGTGFAGTSVLALECKPNPAGAGDCDLTTLKNPFSTIGADGSVSGSFTAKKVIKAGTTTFTCPAVGPGCVVVVTTIDQKSRASAQILFGTETTTTTAGGTTTTTPGGSTTTVSGETTTTATVLGTTVVPTTRHTTTTASTLPRTGSSSAPLALGAVIIAGLGFGLVWFSRRARLAD